MQFVVIDHKEIEPREGFNNWILNSNDDSTPSGLVIVYDVNNTAFHAVLLIFNPFGVTKKIQILI